MCDFLNNINWSDVLEWGLTIIPILISLLTLWQTHKNIKLTRKNIKSMSRPYVSIYVDFIDTLLFEKYIVIKNFGKSFAVINDIQFDKPLDEVNSDAFSSLIGASIVPGQKFSSVISDDFNDTVTATLKYMDSEGVEYKEKYVLKFDLTSNLAWSQNRLSTDSSEATALKQGLHALMKRL
ncbi:hypothetical protein D3H64_09365 [Atopobacter sp. AH10]|uniref:hypothetical protein n=1 Tax=Atopobacter sp. AH10 TaxID=2315861 RepID=UPI000EF261AB|nr:hypothetical protein [Atopobacter sp. AH10]RLK62517.1 hypothetical protein D3H64_09365 [Atopobacter sp. AH10]